MFGRRGARGKHSAEGSAAALEQAWQALALSRRQEEQRSAFVQAWEHFTGFPVVTMNEVDLQNFERIYGQYLAAGSDFPEGLSPRAFVLSWLQSSDPNTKARARPFLLRAGWIILMERDVLGRVTWAFEEGVPESTYGGLSSSVPLEFTMHQITAGEDDLWFPEVGDRARRVLGLIDRGTDEHGSSVRAVPEAHCTHLFTRLPNGEVRHATDEGNTPGFLGAMSARWQLTVQQLLAGEQPWFLDEVPGARESADAIRARRAAAEAKLAELD